MGIIIIVIYYYIEYLVLASGINNHKNTKVPSLAYEIQPHEDK